MDDSPSRHQPKYSLTQPASAKLPNMSMLAMVTPSSFPAFNGSRHSWDVSPTIEPSRQRNDPKAVALPSIRQAFPELLSTISTQDINVKSSNFSPGSAPRRPLTSSEYIHSPESRKRKRISNEDEQETLRGRQVPRLYRSPEPPRPRDISPIRHARTHSFATSLPSPVEIKEKVDQRPHLPTLPPTMTFERELAPHHYRERLTEDYHSTRTPANGAGPQTAREPRAPFQDVGSGYSYHYPARSQSVSSSAGAYDQSQFSAYGGNGAHHHDISRYSDIGAMGRGDGKQRKRRGNLPKETTDQLRTWFVNHLQHPYPTEDEKQELMRKTGLQMNQISNWFINARRRQLPAMIISARAETDVMNRQSRDGKLMSPTERGDLVLGKRDTLHLSDSENGPYDDELDRRPSHMKRGSL